MKSKHNEKLRDKTRLKGHHQQYEEVASEYIRNLEQINGDSSSKQAGGSSDGVEPFGDDPTKVSLHTKESAILCFAKKGKPRCCVDGCLKAARKKRMCDKHYMRTRRKEGYGFCSFEHCESFKRSKSGFCRKHEKISREIMRHEESSKPIT